MTDLVKGDENTCGDDEEWTNLMDKDGLWHVKSTTQQLFCAIEYQIWEFLNVLLKPSPPPKAKIIKAIVSNDYV